MTTSGSLTAPGIQMMRREDIQYAAEMAGYARDLRSYESSDCRKCAANIATTSLIGGMGGCCVLAPILGQKLASSVACTAVLGTLGASAACFLTSIVACSIADVPCMPVDPFFDRDPDG